MRPSVVVAGWGAANVVLALLLLPFGERPFAIVLYLAALVLLAVAALVVRAGVPATPSRPQRLRLSSAPVLPFPLALGLTLAGLGLVWGYWLVAVGVVVTLVAVLPVGRQRRLPPMPVPEPVRVPAEVLVVPHRQTVPEPWERASARDDADDGGPRRRSLLDRRPVRALLAGAVLVLAILRGRSGARGRPR